MKKNTIIYIITVIICIAVIACAIVLAITSRKNNNDNDNIKIIKYIKNKETSELDIEKEVEIKKKKDINTLLEICNNLSLEQDDTTKGLGIRTDIEINLQNGIKLYIQTDLDDYCAYVSNDIKCTIKMPNELLDFVNATLQD